MSQVSKNELIYDNSVSFPNNNAGAITPSDLRAFNVDLIDSTVNQTLYTADSASLYWKIVDVNSEIDVIDIHISKLEIFSSSQEVKDANLASYTGSVNNQLTNLSTSQSIDNQKWVTIGAQSGSWVTESETGSFARVNVSNTFTETQTITGNLIVSNAITSSNSVITNTLKVDLISSESSDTLSIAQNVSLLNSIDISGQLTSSLQQGYVLVGNDINKTIAIPTASFAGSAPVGTATTGSNTYNGTQTITGSLLVSGSTTFIGLHIFSGSVLQSGSLIQNGITELTGSVNISGSTTIRGTTIFNNSSTTITGSLLISGSTTQIGNNTLLGNNTISGSTFVSGNIEIANGANLISHNIKAAGSNGLDILANNGATIATMGQGGGTQANFPGSLSSGQFSASVITGLGSPAGFSSSVDSRLDSIEGTIPTLATTGSNIFSGSQTITGSLFVSGNVVGTILANNNIISGSSQISQLGYSTTGSNTFNGNEIFSGSVRGVVNTQTITSNTASFDLSTGNFFELTLSGSTTTRIEATNIQPGQTINVKVKQSTPTTGSVVFSNQFDFPQVAPYTPTTNANAIDILTFITFDTGSIYSVAVKNLI